VTIATGARRAPPYLSIRRAKAIAIHAFGPPCTFQACQPASHSPLAFVKLNMPWRSAPNGSNARLLSAFGTASIVIVPFVPLE